MLIYIKGPDSFLAREAILRLKKKYLEKNPDGIELIEIDRTSPDGLRGANSTSSSLGEVSWADLKTAPLFATSRLIIIKRAGELPLAEQDNLASILTDLPASSVVVVWDAKLFKANSTLSHICDKSPKKIVVDPLVGVALRDWIKAQATEIGFEISPESTNELVDQYGSDLWAIQTDLKTRQGATNASSWGAVRAEKPFIVFDYIRGRKWPELKTHLVAGYKRGEATELTIGALAAAIRKNVRDHQTKRKMTETLSEIDLALKSGLIEPGDAIALLACYLPGERLSVLGAGQKRVQWEEAWQSLV